MGKELRCLELVNCFNLGEIVVKREKYRASTFQKLLAGVSVITLIVLGISSISEFRGAGARSKILSNVETPAASIIFTQRETLVYATKLALWSNGGATRRTVQIARALLAQRLAVIDSSGRSMGSRADSEYWRALKQADEVVNASPVGILPESRHQATNEILIPIIDSILASSRNLVVSYQKSVDQEMVDLAAETARRDLLNLLLLYFFIASGGLFLFLTIRANLKTFRAVRSGIIDERRELEETLFRLESAQNRVQELQDLDKAKNALISNVNHELRTPLTSIIGYTELMERDEEEGREVSSDYIKILQRNAQILLTLVESLLSLSKFDSARGKLPFESVDLRSVIDNAIFTLTPEATASEVRITADCEGDIYLRGDFNQLNQVFINLLSNAVKFSSSNSEVSIKARLVSEGNRAVISVTDSGIGIDQSEIPQLFQRFFRGSNVEKANYPGSGLGLSIVQEVISHHQGNITVQSQLGHGTKIEIELPLFTDEVLGE